MQGVGFRPFAYRLATQLGLSGQVGNDAAGVWCDIEGPAEILATFVQRLRTELPPLAVIRELVVHDEPPVGGTEFVIATSDSGKAAASLIPPDIAPCTACIDEMSDQANRRFRYPFTCCTDCGPRFTVIDGLPYDRADTSMSAFPLCDACDQEYRNPTDRRFHAQATCCRDCGPTLSYLSNDSASAASISESAALDAAAQLLSAGGILALKGVGGYQLLCRADDSAAVQRLRDRKHRDEKPFAVLVKSVEEAHALADIDDRGERALTAFEAPIVLVRAKPSTAIAAQVAPGTGLLGIMLPASPLHVVLVADVDAPLVCTSGNQSNTPIISDDAESRVALASICDGWLTHDRRIERRADDSVGQVVHDRFQLLRRARGFAPRSVHLPASKRTILGVGASLKNTVCVAIEANATVSVHLGDLENPATLSAFETAIADQLQLHEHELDLVVHDLHPEYLSTKFAMSQTLAPTLAVQHHHAHLASCLADNGEAGKAIGVIFDGMGWGTDATAWGGEFLVGDASEFARPLHLGYVPLPGGDGAARHPWRMAVAHLAAAFGSSWPAVDAVDRHDNVEAVLALCQHPNTVPTSSIGRLFDAVAALCGVADSVTYEGQAAIALEQLADQSNGSYPWPLPVDHPEIDAAPIISAVVDDLTRGVSPSIVAGRFHGSLASMILSACNRLRDETGLGRVALSGGVFQNRLLNELVVPLLEHNRFEVLRHGQVPPNDGGISLGQVAIGRAHQHALLH